MSSKFKGIRTFYFEKEVILMSWPTHIVAAGGYVFDKSGNILIVKTKNRGWDCTGGQIEIGENILCKSPFAA